MSWPYKKYLLAAVVVFIVALFDGFLTKGSVKNFFYKLFNRPSGFLLVNSNRSSEYLKSMFSVGALIAENRELKLKNLELLSETAKNHDLAEENETLREKINLVHKRNAQLDITRIFSVRRTPLSSTALINKGDSSGIKAGMPLVVGGGALVGVVYEVLDDFSRVQLIDDPALRIAAKIEGDDVLGETRGALNNEFNLEFISNEDKIAVGDLVVTSGLDDLPRALAVGRISAIDYSSGLFKTITGSGFFDLSLISDVFVILNYNQLD